MPESSATRLTLINLPKVNHVNPLVGSRAVSQWDRAFGAQPPFVIWRRRRDSNPRYGNSPYGGLANRWFQPLTHVSGNGLERALYKPTSEASTCRRSAGNDLQTHVEPHLFARLEDADAKIGPLLFRSVERRIGVSHRLGDEIGPVLRRIQLEKTRLQRRHRDGVRPIRVSHGGLAVPPVEAVIEILAAYPPLAQIIVPVGNHPLNRKHMLIDRPGVGDPRIELRFRSAGEIGMLAETAGHRAVAHIAARQAERKPRRVEFKFLPRLIIPRPLAGAMIEDEEGELLAGRHNGPGIKPALAVQRTGVARHIGRETHLATAKRETAAPNPVHVRHERKTGRVEYILG